jgi:hypothetical protein
MSQFSPNNRLKADGAKAPRFRRSEAAKAALVAASLASAAPQLSRSVGRYEQ